MRIHYSARFISHLFFLFTVATGSCSVKKLWGGDVTTLVRGCSELGSVVNVTSLLSLPNYKMISGSSPVTCRVPTLTPSATLILSSTAIYAPSYPPYFPFLDHLITQSFTPAGLHRPSLPSLSCCPRPDPQFPLGSFSPAPRDLFCRLPPRPFAPLFPFSTSLVSLLTHVVTPVLVPSFLLHSLNQHPPPPCRPPPEAWSL